MEKCSAVLFVANTADELASLVRAPSAVHEVHAPLGIGGKMESKMGVSNIVDKMLVGKMVGKMIIDHDLNRAPFLYNVIVI